MTNLILSLTPEQIEGIKEHDKKRSELVEIVKKQWEAKRLAKFAAATAKKKPKK